MLISGAQAMYDFGKSLASEHKILLLEGELGAGKTTLIKGFADALGIDTHKVNSPTYTYVQEYDKKLLHIDMYNIKAWEELLHKGILDLIQEYDYIAIERPKFIDQLGLEEALYVQINKKNSSSRELSVSVL